MVQNNSLPFNKYSYLATHNSFAIGGKDFQTDGFRLTFVNQEDTITQQLNVTILISDFTYSRTSYYYCYGYGYGLMIMVNVLFAIYIYNGAEWG